MVAFPIFKLDGIPAAYNLADLKSAVYNRDKCPRYHPTPINGPVHIAKRCGLCLQLRDEFILEVVPRHEPVGLLIEQLGVYAVMLNVFDPPLGI